MAQLRNSNNCNNDGLYWKLTRQNSSNTIQTGSRSAQHNQSDNRIILSKDQYGHSDSQIPLSKEQHGHSDSQTPLSKDQYRHSDSQIPLRRVQYSY